MSVERLDEHLLGLNASTTTRQREPGSTSLPPDSRRFVIVILLHTGLLICYVNRACLSVAIDGSNGIAAELGWDNSTKGTVLSSFFYSYTFVQLVTGWLAVRFGPRCVLCTAFAGQGALSLAFPQIAKSGSLPLVLAARILLGCFQAAFIPSQMQLCAAWLAPAELSRGYAFSDAGSSVGAAIALGLTPLLMKSYGWPSAFYASGALSILWMSAAFHSLSNGPSVDTPGQRLHILENEAAALSERSTQRSTQQSKAAATPWRALLCNASVLCLPICFFAGNYGWYVFLTFLPQYIHNQLGLDLR